MLKIAVLEKSKRNATLRLEGAVTGPWVGELKASCETVLASGGTLTLDLADVSFLAREAVSLIRALMARGVRVQNCSSFTAAQLDTWNGGSQ